jgi:hypothetical protein
MGDVSEHASLTSTFANGPLGLAVLVDEFDAGSFQNTTNTQVVGGCHRGPTFSAFSTTNHGKPELGLPGEIFGTFAA